MPVKIYRSTDVGAPILNGTEGSLVALLDAVLVNGYGAQPPVGWTKEFTGTNKAAYRGSVSTNQFYLQVLDDQGASSNYARVRGFETMSDVDTGVDAFPTVASEPNYYWHKSDSTDADPVNWVVTSNDKIFHIAWISPDNVARAVLLSYGDASTLITGDVWFTVINATDSTNITNASFDSFLWGEYHACRDSQGLTKSITSGSDAFIAGTLSGAFSEPIYPSNPSGKINLLPKAYCSDPTNNVTITNSELRGYVPGLFNLIGNYDDAPLSLAGFEDFATDQDGVQYILMPDGSTAPSRWVAIQISGDWI